MNTGHLDAAEAPRSLWGYGHPPQAPPSLDSQAWGCRLRGTVGTWCPSEVLCTPHPWCWEGPKLGTRGSISDGTRNIRPISDSALKMKQQRWVREPGGWPEGTAHGVCHLVTKVKYRSQKEKPGVACLAPLPACATARGQALETTGHSEATVRSREGHRPPPRPHWTLGLPLPKCLRASLAPWGWTWW